MWTQWYGTVFFRTLQKNHGLCEKILHHLIDTDVNEGNESKWIRYDFQKKNDYVYDLGLPHGMVGVLYFIGKCYEAGIRKKDCERLVKQGSQFFLNSIQDPIQSGSYFPNKISAREYANGAVKKSISRMAWCYGDLTILYSLYRNLKLVGADTTSIIQILLSLCQRINPIQTSVSDPGLCHGSSGVAHLFHKLYKETNHNDFSNASKYWLNETFQYGGKDGYGGFLFEAGNDEKMVLLPSSAILEGIGGIGLIRSSFIYEDSTNNWDECIFLS
ncbi:lanthionine synthetase LanC family protein [Pedobacter sandarakinus]|uniref:lanthionine synthetase LanC family protein n=1 Tax=Pedobacter sandarakinus TaxID=353156 RepID=UPI0022459E71|nr:lanthionine synthetase LanC family protein [Pedobacter sandarakinus]MCX2576127.1 hypothetical protein [Pedobacter sandarakinus]